MGLTSLRCSRSLSWSFPHLLLCIASFLCLVLTYRRLSFAFLKCYPCLLLEACMSNLHRGNGWCHIIAIGSDLHVPVLVCTRPVMYQSCYFPVPLCIRPIVFQSRCVSDRLYSSPSVYQTDCFPIPLCIRLIVCQSHCIYNIWPVVFQSHCVSGRLCIRPIVFQSHCVLDRFVF